MDFYGTWRSITTMGRAQSFTAWRLDSGQHPKFKQRDNQFATRDHSKQRQCVYCESDDHRAVECTKVVDVGEGKKILSVKRRCFNCTGENHRASECKSKTQCYKWQRMLQVPTQASYINL